MALDKMLAVAKATKRERAGKSSGKTYKKIHYVSFTEVLNQREADAAGDKVVDQWPSVKQAFGDVDDIRQGLLTLAGPDVVTTSLANGTYLMRLTHEQFAELSAAYSAYKAGR